MMLAAIPSRRVEVPSLRELLKSANISIDSVSLTPHISSDAIDNPIHKQNLEPDVVEENILEQMKSECNRLYSFQNKWPLSNITPESLSEAGFFYLQHEDKVQCPFCSIILYNWTQGDKPLREHMKRSPKCPFLMGKDVGNVPLSLEKPQNNHEDPAALNRYPSNSVNVTYKPKHPRMSDVKRRLLTYSGWPLNEPKPQRLAECGLYYSGIADVVTCFFCGGTLGNWEPDDDPAREHVKFFPECSYLALTKSKKTSSQKSTEIYHKTTQQHSSNGLTSADTTSEIVKQALDIFPQDLVSEAVKRRNGSPFSLQDICDDILDLKQKSETKITPSVPVATKTGTSLTANNDLLLCKVCMDRERGIVFQPCGHFVSCWNCANLIADCPVCRQPIIHKIKTYIS